MREVKRCTGGWSNKASLRGSSCFAQTAIVQGESMANVSTRRRLQHLKNQSEVLRAISNYMSAFFPQSASTRTPHPTTESLSPDTSHHGQNILISFGNFNSLHAGEAAVFSPAF